MSSYRFFTDHRQLQRYGYALCMSLLMVIIAEATGEKEILFPEMAALTIGMWIVDKRVWQITKFRLLLLMTAGAVAGVCITRYSPFPLLANLGMAFTFAALCLILSRTTLTPLLSACMLPVLLHTESWIYPVAVSTMSLILISGQEIMERKQLRSKTEYIPVTKNLKSMLLSWLFLLLTVLLIASLGICSGYLYLILPPLIVTYVEFAHSKAGFRNRPTQVWLVLTTAALLGCLFQWIGYYHWHLPEGLIALAILLCLFCLFELLGKFFAPAGALALVPMLLPPDLLLWVPIQVAAGAALFIGIAMVCFQKCLSWPRAQLIFCLTPSFLRRLRKHQAS